MLYRDVTLCELRKRKKLGFDFKLKDKDCLRRREFWDSPLWANRRSNLVPISCLDVGVGRAPLDTLPIPQQARLAVTRERAKVKRCMVLR